MNPDYLCNIGGKPLILLSQVPHPRRGNDRSHRSHRGDHRSTPSSVRHGQRCSVRATFHPQIPPTSKWYQGLTSEGPRQISSRLLSSLDSRLLSSLESRLASSEAGAGLARGMLTGPRDTRRSPKHLSGAPVPRGLPKGLQLTLSAQGVWANLKAEG